LDWFTGGIWTRNSLDAVSSLMASPVGAQKTGIPVDMKEEKPVLMRFGGNPAVPGIEPEAIRVAFWQIMCLFQRNPLVPGMFLPSPLLSILLFCFLIKVKICKT
jgi:hypothetical protein